MYIYRWMAMEASVQKQMNIKGVCTIKKNKNK